MNVDEFVLAALHVKYTMTISAINNASLFVWMFIHVSITITSITLTPLIAMIYTWRASIRQLSSLDPIQPTSHNRDNMSLEMTTEALH